MAFWSGIIQTEDGYESYSDGSGSAIYLAEKLLKQISDSKFNPGQQAIVEKTEFDPDDPFPGGPDLPAPPAPTVIG